MPAQKTQNIQARVGKCRCGCHGQDPWHKPKYKRLVRDEVPVEHEANQNYRPLQIVVARGVASFPWGEEPVVAFVWSFDGKVQRTRDWQLETLKR